MKFTTFYRIWSRIKYAWLVIAVIYVIVFTCCSCSSSCSRSGRLMDQPLEKVVVLGEWVDDKDNLAERNAEPDNQPAFSYRVYRLKYKVTTNIYSFNQYIKGDTVLHRFPPDQTPE